MSEFLFNSLNFFGTCPAMIFILLSQFLLRAYDVTITSNSLFVHFQSISTEERV